MARLTLLDVAKIDATATGEGRIVGLIEENLQYVPELTVFPVDPIEDGGTSYETLVRTGYPSVSFRSANQGVTPSKSTFAIKLIQCYILSSRIEIDDAVAEAQKDNGLAMEMLEADGVMKQVLIELASQIWYGVTVDDKGFPGIKAATALGGATTVNSGGSNATSQSSVYGVKFGKKDVRLVTGGGRVFSLGEFRKESCEDADGAKFPGRVADLMGWVGQQIGSVNSVSRLANVGDTGETGDMLTDAKLQLVLDKLPVGYKPDAWFASRRSVGQLQTSRTVTINAGPTQSVTGNVALIADRPTSSGGIPLYETDAIGITDAVET